MGWFRRGNPMDPQELERIKAEVRSLRDAIAAHDERRQQQERNAPAARAPDPDPRLEELAGKLSDLDRRVTAVSTELANQVSELGNDIDALAERPPGDGPGEVVIEELRDGQVRLANEQARYQMAFREDLARLAEQLRRPST